MKALLTKKSEKALKLININLTSLGLIAFLLGTPLIFIAEGVLILYIIFIFLFGLAIFNVSHLTNNNEDIYFMYRSVYGRRVFFLLLPIIPFLSVFKNCYSNPKNMKVLLERLYENRKSNLITELSKTGKIKEALDSYFDMASDMTHECWVDDIDNILFAYLIYIYNLTNNHDIKQQDAWVRRLYRNISYSTNKESLKRIVHNYLNT